MSLLRFAFTVDDVALHRYKTPDGFESFSSVEDLRELVGFLDGQGVPGTFLVVPFNEDIPLYERAGYVAALAEAQAAGHKLEMHGLRHEIFEWGIPPEQVLELPWEEVNRRRVETDRANLEREFAYDVLVGKLRQGIEIFERALGGRPVGFRAPCGSTSPGLFRALVDCGFGLDSSLIVNRKGWNYVLKDYRPGIFWNPKFPPRPHRLEAGIVEVPIMSEYTWKLTDQDVPRHLDLLKEDLDHLAETGGGVMVSVCHVSPTTGQWAAGQKVYEQFFRYARDKYDVQFCTLREAVAEHE